MKILIFAGGTGKRLWPLSTVETPKQFVPLVNNKSTFQMMIEMVEPIYGRDNIYVSTNENYVPMVKEQAPQLRTTNIIAEPYCRDVAAGVGFAFMKLRKMGIKEPVAILWGDGLVKNAKKFDDVLALSKKVILNKKASIVLVGEFPTYPNNEIGWITVGDKIKSKDSENSTNLASFPFVEFVYRPDVHACGRLFEGGTGLWNTGYFISTIVYILSLYKKYKPQMYQQLVEMEKVFDTEKEGEVVSKIYPEIEKVHFDHVVPYNIKPKDAIVVGAKMGWFDPGTLYALKKFFAPNEENYTSGNAIAHNCRDCMILNKEGGKIVAIVGLEGKIVVNTKDALLVIDKDQVGEIKEVLELM